MEATVYVKEGSMSKPFDDPREQRVLHVPELECVEPDDSVAQAALEREANKTLYYHKRKAAKEAIQTICDALPDGFHALLQRDRLRDVFGDKLLNEVFDEILDERRR